ncbi:aminopeptidase N, partial [Myxococcota bacterium]|nr:aminopeptidase N [Myxococcota bacterium]
MKKSEKKYLSDYRVPSHFIEKCELSFFIEPQGTTVRSLLSVTENLKNSGQSLFLNGKNLKTKAVAVNGERLPESGYTLGDDSLEIPSPGPQFTVEIEVLIDPDTNSSLEGLYRSGAILCTQCEPEGFRKITWFPDRPDILSTFRVRIEADSGTYPVLLSNGNLTASGVEGDNHWVQWEDPHPKPSYLFALVAGQLSRATDSFATMSGRSVSLEVYVEEKDVDKAHFALYSLKEAMKWDEDKFGREYDLDRYMIVAVDSFNHGAMENKGLNIFNSKYVLASKETATDDDYDGVLGVIAHEYFHNWTGNRVTLRDWFHLSLKEGLTVFRDQEFSSDLLSRSVKRIEDARFIRTVQFLQDNGPRAHAVRPDSYLEMNNFYTVTIYQKGAELIRMERTLIGPERFREGMDIYFERHDGEAVIIEDFVRAMADASGFDFTHFMRWYSQAGTPVLEISDEYNPVTREYTLRVTQS